MENTDIRYSRAALDSAILPERTLKKQVFLELSKYVRHCQLSDALTLLSTYGIAGEAAVSFISSVQGVES